MSSEPSGRAVKTSGPSGDVRSNTMDEPSGDHAGFASSDVPSVTVTGVAPGRASSSINDAPEASSLENRICECDPPSGDHAGATSLTSGVTVMLVCSAADHVGDRTGSESRSVLIVLHRAANAILVPSGDQDRWRRDASPIDDQVGSGPVGVHRRCPPGRPLRRTRSASRPATTPVRRPRHPRASTPSRPSPSMPIVQIEEPFAPVRTNATVRPSGEIAGIPVADPSHRRSTMSGRRSRSWGSRPTDDAARLTDLGVDDDAVADARHRRHRGSRRSRNTRVEHRDTADGSGEHHHGQPDGAEPCGSVPVASNRRRSIRSKTPAVHVDGPIVRRSSRVRNSSRSGIVRHLHGHAVEPVRQCDTRSGELALHGSFVHPKRGRRLGGVQVEQVTQHDDLSLPAGSVATARSTSIGITPATARGR